MFKLECFFSWIYSSAHYSKLIFFVCLAFAELYFRCREVIDSTMKVGEANARLKQLEVALDSAQIEKQNAEAEVALAKEKAELSKLELNQIEKMVILFSWLLFGSNKV